MNTNSIARSTSAQWLNRGIAAVGIVLMAGAFAFGLANSAPILAPPAAVPASNASPASERFVALKQAQAEWVMDAAMGGVIAPAVSERFAELKQRQAELRDTTVVPAQAPVSGRDRFIALKERQAEARDTTSIAPTGATETNGHQRFVEFKQRQAEAMR